MAWPLKVSCWFSLVDHWCRCACMGSEASRWLKWDCPYFGPLLLSTLITPFQIMSIISIFKVNQLSNLDFFFLIIVIFFSTLNQLRCSVHLKSIHIGHWK